MTSERDGDWESYQSDLGSGTTAPPLDAALMTPTRRGFMLGSAAVIISGGDVLADDVLKPAFEVGYGPDGTGSIVISRNVPGDERSLEIQANLFGEAQGSGSTAARFVLKRTQAGWLADVRNALLPGIGSFDLAIEIVWDGENDQNNGHLRLRLTVGGTALVLATDNKESSTKDLASFLPKVGNVVTDEQGDSEELAGKVPAALVPRFIASVLGEGAGIGNARDVTLSYHRGGYWRLRCATGMFSVLPNENLAAGCQEVRFGVLKTDTFSERSGADDPDSRRLIRRQVTAVPAPLRLAVIADEPAVRDVRDLFEGQGAPSFTSDGRERVLFALAHLTTFAGHLAFGVSDLPGSSRDTARLEAAEAIKPEWVSGWRNNGDGNPVVALQGPLQLRIIPDVSRPSIPVTLMNSGFATVWQRRDATDKRTLRTVCALRPTGRFHVDTRFGRFNVAPLPAYSLRPGTKAETPAIRLASEGEAKKRILRQFAAPLALEQAAIGLQASHTTSTTDVFSTLYFDEAECLFRIPGTALGHQWDGVLTSQTDPPQAEAIIYLGHLVSGSPVRISLNRAHLSIRRPRDLLALSYRFQDLILERDELTKIGEPRWWVTPDRRIAAFAAYAPARHTYGLAGPQRSGEAGSAKDTPRAEIPPQCDDPSPSAISPLAYASIEDRRPVMVVEFPPQHIAEQAFFRQIKADPSLPELPLASRVSDADAEKLRSGPMSVRISLRKKIAAIQRRDDNPNWPDNIQKMAFGVFAARFDAAAKLDKRLDHAQDQRTYVGPQFLDPVSIRIARRVATSLDEETLKAAVAGAEDKDYLLHTLPEIDPTDDDLHQLRQSAGIPHDKAQEIDTWAWGAEVPQGVSASALLTYIRDRESLKDRRDYDYQQFREFYTLGIEQQIKFLDDKASVAALRAAELFQHGSQEGNGNKRPEYWGRRSYIRYIARLGTADDVASITIRGILSILKAFTAYATQRDAFQIPAEARASGRSRLVFRISADDFEGGRPDNVGRPAGALPFTIEGLTNWGSFDLAVVRRAEKLFDPLPGGRAARRWDRNETRDEAAKLAFQGISGGDAWSRRRDEDRLETKLGCPPPIRSIGQALGIIRSGEATGDQRMAEIAIGSQQAPSWNETSIEVPFRLMLSPAQDALWRTPLGLPEQLRSLSDPARPTPLWFASLDEPTGSSSLRAVWSPDFRPEALLDPELGGPPHGPWAPWAMPRDVTSRDPYTEKQKPERFRSSLDAYDRHELVMLTSIHGLPVRGRRRPDGTLVDTSQINPPPGFRLRQAQKEKLDPRDSSAIAADWSAIYMPKPIGSNELTLTALGGSIDFDTNFFPPVSARAGKVPRNLFDALSVERWRHNAVLGRDIKVEVVYKGFLFPLGHRASLVKLTERRFVAAIAGGPPVAFLVQRMFLRVGNWQKQYPALLQPNGGRRWPAESVDVLTRVTPDIVDPMDSPDPVASNAPSSDKVSGETANGRIFLRARSSDGGEPRLCAGLVFWPKVRAAAGGEVRFELQIDKRGARTRMPLVFVDNTAANDVQTLKALTSYYSSLVDGTNADPRRIMDHGGSTRRYAPEREPDDTSFETRTWTLEAEGFETAPPGRDDSAHGFRPLDNATYDFIPLLQGADQPPFYPLMRQAQIRVAQIDRLTGATTKPVSVSFDDEYTSFGFPDDQVLQQNQATGASTSALTDVYLEFDARVSMDFGQMGDRAGGTASTPTDFIGLSRTRGPVGGPDLKQLAAGPNDRPTASSFLVAPEVKTFFNPKAKILGILEFDRVLKFVGDGMSKTPAFREVAQFQSQLLNSLSDDIALGATRVRDVLLIPMRQTLVELATQFADAAGSAASAATGMTQDGAVERLASLYPDLGRAYLDMKHALDDTIAACGSATELGGLLVHFAKIYAAGMRFVAAIDRLAADPVAPARAELRNVFNGRISSLLAQTGAIAQGIQNELQTIATKASTLVRVLIADENLGAWRRMVFAVPAARDGAGARLVRVTVDAALTRALATESWIGKLVSNGADEAARAIVRSMLDGPVGLSELAKSDPRLSNAIDDWRADGMEDFERLQGFLFKQTMTQLRAIHLAASALSGDFKTIGVEQVQALLRDLLNNVTTLLLPAMDDLLLDTRQICTTSLIVLRDLLRMVAPRVSGASADAQRLQNATTAVTSSLQAFSGRVVEYQNAASSADAPLAAALGALKSKVDLFKTAIEQATPAAQSAANAMQKAAQSFADAADNGLPDKVCTTLSPSDLPALPLDALSALGAPRAKLVDSLSKVMNAAIGLRACLIEGGGILSILKAQEGDLAAIILPALSDAAKLNNARIRAVRAVKTLVAELAGFSAMINEFVREVTSLKVADDDLKTVADRIETLAKSLAAKNADAGERLRDAFAPFADIVTFRAEITPQIRTALDTLKNLRTDTSSVLDDLRKNVDALAAQVDATGTRFQDVRNRLIERAENRLISAAAERLVAAEQASSAISQQAFAIIRPAINALAAVQEEIEAGRTAVYKEIATGIAINDKPSDLLADLAKATVADIGRLLVVARPAEALPTFAGEKSPPTGPQDDYLKAEAVQLRKLAAAEPIDPGKLNEIARVFGRWRNGNASAAILFRTLKRASELVLSGDLSRIVDLAGARRKIEAGLKDMIPSRLSLGYDLTAEMAGFPDDSETAIFLPQGNKLLTLSAGATYDLLNPDKAPEFFATGTMAPFDINLFSVVTLMFDGARFTNDSKKGSDFKLFYRDVKIGKRAEFLEPLQSYLNPTESGPYVIPLRGSPGIEAGYSLFIGVIAIGTLSFSNVSLNASCRLPFDNREAIFNVSIGRRDKPFLISALPYTGGGFLGLLANSKGIIGLEASFEFGGGGAFKFGLLEGQGRITMGIYVNQIDDGKGGQDCTIDGFFYAGGEAHITRFSVCATLVVRISQQNGQMNGSAVFTYSFSLGIADIDFSIAVQKNEGKGFSGDRSAMATPSSITRFAQLGIDPISVSSIVPGPVPGPTLSSRAISLGVDWQEYDTYFANDIDGFPR